MFFFLLHTHMFINTPTKGLKVGLESNNCAQIACTLVRNKTMTKQVLFFLSERGDKQSTQWSSLSDWLRLSHVSKLSKLRVHKALGKRAREVNSSRGAFTVDSLIHLILGNKTSKRFLFLSDFSYSDS